MKTIAILSATLLSVLPAAAQYVQKWVSHHPPEIYDNSRGYSLAVDSAGNVIVTGRSNGTHIDQNISTIKYDGATGNPVWTVIHDGAAEDEIDAGSTTDQDEGRGVAVDAEDNVLVVGWVTHTAGNVDGYTAKYDGATGALLWERRYDRAGRNDTMLAVATDSTGDVIAVGLCENSSGNGDYYVTKYAGDTGETRWEAFYNGDANRRDFASAVAVDAADNIVVTGASEGPPTNSQTNYDFQTFRFSPAGVILWSDRVDGPNHRSDHPTGLALGGGGSIHITGNSYNGSNYDMLTVKYQTPDFNLAWSRRHSGAAPASEDNPLGIAVSNSGDVAITGFTGVSQSDIYTALYSGADGAVLWEAPHDGPAHQNDRGAGVAFDAHGDILMTGQSSRVTAGHLNTDYYTARYAAADGSLVWGQYYNGPGNRWDGMDTVDIYQNRTVVAPTPGDGIVVTGYAGRGPSSTVFTDISITTVKYGPPFHEIEVASPSEVALEDGTTTIDFGMIEIGSSSEDRVFTVRNLGDETLSGIAVAIQGPDAALFSADLTQVTATLAPGGQFTFTVGFNPDLVGPKSAFVRIDSDDADESPFEIDLAGSGFIAPDILVEDGNSNDLAWSSNTYSFSDWVEEGQSGVPVVFTIRNTGTAPLNLGMLELGGDHAADFVVDAGSLDATLEPSEFTTFTVTFQPVVSGTKGATVSIPSDDPDESPYVISLNAYSPPPPPPLAVAREGGNPLASGESQHDFGEVMLGGSGEPVAFTVTNNSGGNLPNVSVTVTGGEGSHPADFPLVVGGIPNPLPPGGEFTFTLNFTPSGSGQRYATANVIVDGNESSAFTFTLLGYGIEAEFTLYEDWAAEAGLEGDDALPEAAPFGDGVANLLKYAFNMDGSGPDHTILDPGAGDAGLPAWSLHGDGPGRVLRVVFMRRVSANLTYRPECSADLGESSFVEMTTMTDQILIDHFWERVTFETPADPEVSPKLLGRVAVILEPIGL